MERFSHGGNIYEEAPPEGGWLDFSANINPLGLPARVRESILHHIDDLVHYPDPEGRELKAAISSFYHLPEDEIILGNGAAELFYLFFSTMRFSNVLLPQPTFSEYERAALAAGSHVEYVFLGADFCIPWEKLCSALSSADCIVLGNPNNPTGTLFSTEELEECMRNVPCMPWILVDESFMDFRGDAETYTVRHLVEKYPRVFLVQSLTKFYALPGLRLGFGAAPPKLVKRLEAAKDVWNVNLLAQKSGVAALSDVEYQQKTLRWLPEERAYMERALGEIPGMKLFSPSVNFVLVNVRETGKDAPYILSEMKKRGILLRDCGNYPFLDSSYLRMAIRSHEENLRLLAAWKEIIGN